MTTAAGCTRRGKQPTFEAAAAAGFALAQVASGAGDRVGLLVYGRGVQQRLAPARGAAHLRAMLESLAVARAEPSEAAHAAAAATVLAAQKRRALVVWLTDVAETAALPEVIESAAHLVPQHVLVFAVPRPTDVVAVAAAVPDSERDLYRGLAAQEIVERRTGLLADLRQRGVNIEAPSAALTGTVVDRYLQVKERNLPDRAHQVTYRVNPQRPEAAIVNFTAGAMSVGETKPSMVPATMSSGMAPSSSRTATAADSTRESLRL